MFPFDNVIMVPSDTFTDIFQVSFNGTDVIDVNGCYIFVSNDSNIIYVT